MYHVIAAQSVQRKILWYVASRRIPEAWRLSPDVGYPYQALDLDTRPAYTNSGLGIHLQEEEESELYRYRSNERMMGAFAAAKSRKPPKRES